MKTKIVVVLLTLLIVLLSADIVLRLYPNNANTLVKEADQYAYEASFINDSGKADEILTYKCVSKYMEALSIEPSRWQRLENIAGAYYRSGDYQLSLAYIDKALSNANLSRSDRKHLEDFRNQVKSNR